MMSGIDLTKRKHLVGNGVMAAIVSVFIMACSSGDMVPKADMDNLNEKIESLDSQVNSLTDEVATKNSEIQSLNTEIDNNSNELEDLNKKYKDTVAENELLSTSLTETKSKLETSQKDYDSLKKEYNAYKEKMAPYEELDAKEAEVRKLEAEKALAEEEARKEKEEEEAKKKKEAEEKKGYETGITYKQLARTPDDYIYSKVKFSGRVIQVIEGNNEIDLRMAVNKDYDTILYCVYEPDLVPFRILEDDIITVYGYSVGVYSYQSTGAGQITIPCMLVEKLELKE